MTVSAHSPTYVCVYFHISFPLFFHCYLVLSKCFHKISCRLKLCFECNFFTDFSLVRIIRTVCLSM
jgi:hypothetical protein